MSIRRSTQSRSPTLLVALAVVVLLAAAVTFARSDQSLRVAQDATLLRHAERGSAAASLYRANLAIAVVASATDSTSAAGRAVEASGSARERLAVTADSLVDQGLNQRIEALGSTHDAVVAQLAAGDVAGADRRVTQEALPLLGDIQATLDRTAAEASSRIEAEHASAGQTARMSSFVVALIAPVLALWAYRRSAQKRLVSERLEAELNRQRDLATAQQSLISGMSHQLRTPLTGIYGFAEAIITDGETGEGDAAFVREAGQTILGESNRLRVMVDDFLVTARHKAGDLSYEHAAFDLVAEIQAASDPYLRLGTEIVVECPPVQLFGDRLRVRHVLRNVIDNAHRHGRPPVRIVGSSGKGFELWIEDHGDGPPPGDIFRTFIHSGNDALITGSLGLGLGVCRMLCDDMRIHLEMRHSDGVTRAILGWDLAAVSRSMPQRDSRVGLISVRP